MLFLVHLYVHKLMQVASLTVNTIITATVAYTSILHGRFNDVAETAYMLLKREFEYEFVSVRWSFITSML